VRGEVKLLLDADSDSHRVKKGGVVYIKKPTRRSPRAVRVLSSRRQGSVEGKQVVFLAHLEGVSTRTAAEAFKQYELYIRDDSIPETQGREEYMIRELVGLRCYLWSELASAGVPISAVSSGDHASRGSEGQTAPNVRTDPPELSLDKVLLDTIGALSPVAVVVGVVPPEELCDSPAAARLMHAQLEVQLLFPEPRPRSPLPAAASISGKLAAISTATAPPRRRKALYCLVPLVPSIVRRIDLPSGALVLDPPAGLLAETYELSERVGPIKGFLPAHVAALSVADRAYLAERVTTVSS
jgi:ribosomal 30S subunit maturation factor RimM